MTAPAWIFGCLVVGGSVLIATLAIASAIVHDFRAAYELRARERGCNCHARPPVRPRPVEDDVDAELARLLDPVARQSRFRVVDGGDLGGAA